MRFDPTLALVLLLSSSILCRCTVLFDTLRKTIELQRGDSLDELEKAALESKIREAISSACELLNLENFESEDCEPDFSGFCPENWSYLGDGVHCKANPDYAGSCDRVMDFSDKTPSEKLRLSRACSFNWPCRKAKAAYVPVKVTQCPKFWVTKDATCVPHASYSGLCNELSLEQLELGREELTLKCNLEWDNNPFNVENLLDLTENCPLGYTGTDLCTPVENFSPKFQGPLHFESKQAKILKTNLYNLTWNFKMFNAEHLDEPCPYQWTLDPDTGLCLAPPTYTGPCQLRADFSKMSRKVKNIWAAVCLVDFYPNPGSVKRERVLREKLYKDGAIESRFKILKRRRNNETDTAVEILQKQLNELYKLRKSSTDDNFLSTLQYTIDKLEKRIVAPSFLQITSTISTKRYNCPYNWDEYADICVSPKTYSTFVPNCFTIISRLTQKSDESCRLQFNNDHEDNEDFVREPCPLDWKRERKQDGRLIRTICRPKNGQMNYKFTQCGTRVDFTNVSPNFKRHWAYACNVKFPAKSHRSKSKCKENFFRKCPYGWTEESGVCVAPGTYFGPCKKTVNLSEIATAEQKQSFSESCLAFWDCLDNCEKDYSEVCPKGWRLSGNRCMATYKYDFPCAAEFTVPQVWNEFAKQEFEFVCQAYWECKA